MSWWLLSIVKSTKILSQAANLCFKGKDRHNKRLTRLSSFLKFSTRSHQISFVSIKSSIGSHLKCFHKNTRKVLNVVFYLWWKDQLRSRRPKKDIWEMNHLTACWIRLTSGTEGIFRRLNCLRFLFLFLLTPLDHWTSMDRVYIMV